MTDAVSRALTLAARDAKVESYQLIYLVAIPFGVVAVSAALCIKSIEPWQRSENVAAHLENDKWAQQQRAREAAIHEIEEHNGPIKA